MKVTQLKIRPHEFNDSKLKKIINVLKNRYVPISFFKDENNYIAELIEKDSEFFYRVDGTTVKITHDEYENVIINPRLYYFSTALKLHHRILRAKELGLGRDWPTSPAAPKDIFDLLKD